MYQIHAKRMTSKTKEPGEERILVMKNSQSTKFRDRGDLRYPCAKTTGIVDKDTTNNINNGDTVANLVAGRDEKEEEERLATTIVIFFFEFEDDDDLDDLHPSPTRRRRSISRGGPAPPTPVRRLRRLDSSNIVLLLICKEVFSAVRRPPDVVCSRMKHEDEAWMKHEAWKWKAWGLILSPLQSRIGGLVRGVARSYQVGLRDMWDSQLSAWHWRADTRYIARWHGPIYIHT